MSRNQKLKARLFSNPKDFTWDELISVLRHEGYEQLPPGGTSARKFADARSHIINIHKPHPGNIVKAYVIKLVCEALKAKEEELKGKLK